MCTRGRGRGARVIMICGRGCRQRFDVAGARACLFGLQRMITGMLGDGSVLYGDTRQCRVSTPDCQCQCQCHSHWLCILCGCTRQ